MPVSVAALEPYLRALLDENQRINLTGIRDFAVARVLHAEDSLAIQAVALPTTPRTCLDLGTGNGFPGVTLRFVFPTASITLLDRTRKKLLAIERALTAAGIDGIETLHADARQVPVIHPDLCHHFDLITARAVTAPKEVAELAIPLLAASGRLVLWLDEQTPPPASLAGLGRQQTIDYKLPEPAARHRYLGCYANSPHRGRP